MRRAADGRPISIGRSALNSEQNEYLYYLIVEKMREKIEQLRRQINEHNYRYYVLNDPLIGDYEFDALLRELQELEAAHPEFDDPNSPTRRVGSDSTNEFATVEHRYPMLSLSNTYSLDEIREFDARVRKEVGEAEYVCELKFDGTAISLTYENGRLLRAVTRGDGTRGDDVTANVRTIRSVPLQLRGAGYPAYFEIRGEILMPFRSFERLNREREDIGETPFANPRNAAAGSLKQQSSAETARRELDCTLYSLVGDDLPFGTHYDSLMAAREWGFKISDQIALCRDMNEIDEYIRRWDKARKELPVRNRRRRDQGRQFRASAPPRLYGQGAALGRRLQVQGRAGADSAAVGRFSGRKDRSDYARSQSGAGSVGRYGRQARLAAQCRTDRAARYPAGRPCVCGKGGRDHP